MSILDDTKDTIEEAISDYEHVLKSNFRDAIHSIVFEKRCMEPEESVLINKIVDTLFETSKRAGPVDESWPEYDKEELMKPFARLRTLGRGEKKRK